MDNQINQPLKLFGLIEQVRQTQQQAIDGANEILGNSGRKSIKVLARELDIDLPVYHLPDGDVYIGFNCPTPWELGYGR